MAATFGDDTFRRRDVDGPLDNVGKLRQAYQLWHDTRGGSAQHWLDLMADDVRMRSLTAGTPEMAFTKANHGKDEAARYFAGLAADWEMVHFTPAEFIAQGDRVVVLSTCAFRHRQTGKVAESPKADVFRFRGGRIVEFFEFFDTARALAATRPD
jgi:ketosteroid isomerase-like protein